MSRFQPLFQHFEQTVQGMLSTVTTLSRDQLAMVYDKGEYRVYEAVPQSTFTADPIVINPAAEWMQHGQLWFFYDQQGLAAFVEYQPDYRPELRVSLCDPLLALKLRSDAVPFKLSH